MEKFILEQINKINEYFITKNISYIKYDWTDNKTIFCQISINNYNIYIEIFFDNDLKDIIETIIGVYKDKDCKLAYGGMLSECLKRINLLIKDK